MGLFTCGHEVQQDRTPKKKQDTRSRLDFFFEREGAFSANFIITTLEFPIFLQISASLPCYSLFLVN